MVTVLIETLVYNSLHSLEISYTHTLLPSIHTQDTEVDQEVHIMPRLGVEGSVRTHTAGLDWAKLRVLSWAPY